jgi:hypothetical protein
MNAAGGLARMAFPKALPDFWAMVETLAEPMDHSRDADGATLSPEVYLEKNDPRIYAIQSGFEGARSLIRELEMPGDPAQLYFLGFFRGERFINKKGYVLEEFGLTTREPGPYHVFYSRPGNTPYRPRYWRLLGGRLVQVWRSRVLACNVQDIGTTLSNPFSPQNPNVMFFEETWHPNKGRSRMIGSIQNRRRSHTPDLNAFCQDALRILRYTTNNPGLRDYSNAYRFFRDLEDSYTKLSKMSDRRPTMQMVAVEMRISRKTLRKYLDRFDIDWPPDFP